MTPKLLVDRATVTTSEAGETEIVVVRAEGVAGEVLVTISGLNANEGALSAGTLLLNAANSWTANLAITGVDDEAADGSAAYTLTLAAAGLPEASVTVTNLDDDLAATNGGKPYGQYLVSPSVVGATKGAQFALDSRFTTLREGVTADGATIDFRWQFVNLAPGDKVMQVVANSTTEAFRFEYSADNGTTWQRFMDAPDSALSWDGEFIATGVGSVMWVRLVDAVVQGDTVRDTIIVNLFTMSDAQVSGIEAIW